MKPPTDKEAHGIWLMLGLARADLDVAMETDYTRSQWAAINTGDNYLANLVRPYLQKKLKRRKGNK